MPRRDTRTPADAIAFLDESGDRTTLHDVDAERRGAAREAPRDGIVPRGARRRWMMPPVIG
jgi:hypothetical protein